MVLSSVVRDVDRSNTGFSAIVAAIDPDPFCCCCTGPPADVGDLGRTLNVERGASAFKVEKDDVGADAPSDDLIFLVA